MNSLISSFSLYKCLFTVELLVGMAIATRQLHRREKFPVRVLLSSAVLLLTAYFFPVLWYNPFYTSFLFLTIFGLTLIAAHLCFDEPPINILFCGITAYTTQHIAYQTFNFLLTIAGVANYGDMYLQETPVQVTLFSSVIYLISYILIYWVIWVVISSCLQGEEDLDIGNRRAKLLLSSVIVLVDVVLNAVLVYGIKGTRLPTAAYVVIYLQSVLCCSLALAVHFALLWRESEKREVARVKELWNTDRVMYEKVRESIDLINIKCHDLKYQISALRQGSTEVSSESLLEIEDAISIYSSVLKTGNQVLDTILAERALECEYEHIRLVCMVDGAELSFISPNSLYSLFGNAISNAIEAVRKVDDDEKKLIHLNVYRRNDMVFIHVDNYCAATEAPVITNGYPETSKSDRNNHGFGMRSMHMMAEKLGGSMEYHMERDMFHLNFFFPVTSAQASASVAVTQDSFS